MDRKFMLLFMVLLLPLSGCQEKKKLLILGVDSLDWPETYAYMEAGAMPNLLELYNEGLHGPLQTETPTISAVIWTTIATGLPRDQHGITSFWVQNTSESETAAPMTSSHRQTPAWWNYLSDAGVKVANIGWWTTYPAEEVVGYNISNLAYHYYRDRIPNATSPETLLNEVAYISVDLSRMLRNYGGFLTPDEQFAMQENGPRRNGHVWESFYRDVFHAESALYLIRKDPDIQTVSVFLDQLDLMRHHYMNYKHDLVELTDDDFRVDPYKPLIRLSDEEMARIDSLPPEERKATALKMMENVIGKFHQHVDMLIGKIVDEFVDENTLVILISDHGFDYTDSEELPEAPKVPAGHQKGPPGVLLMAGNGVKPGYYEGATIYDILPTILDYYDIRVDVELPGKSLLGVEPAGPARKIVAQAPVDPGVTERLKSMGYVE